MINKVYENAVISLVKSAIDGTKAEIPADIDWKLMLSFSKTQSLIPLIHYGMSNSGIKIQDEIEAHIGKLVLKHFLLDQQQQFEITRIQNAFEQAAVDYMPIKGVLLRHLYPKTEMRPMGDADIMFRESQRESVVKIMETLGYEYSHETAHELVYTKGKIVIELHKCLIPPRTKDFYEYYKDSWSFARKVDGTPSRYEMSDEDHLIFLVTHFAKHYRAGGIGVIHMADFYLFLKKKSLNHKYVREELKKLSLLKFYDNVVATIEAWFNDGPRGERTDFITHRIFANGLWGTRETKTMAAAVRRSKSSSVKSIGLKYTIKQIFPGSEGMQLRYPMLRKHKYLLPVLWVVRWFDILLFKHDRMRNKLKQIEHTTEKNVSAYQDELRYVGLDFNYEE